MQKLHMVALLFGKGRQDGNSQTFVGDVEKRYVHESQTPAFPRVFWGKALAYGKQHQSYSGRRSITRMSGPVKNYVILSSSFGLFH